MFKQIEATQTNWIVITGSPCAGKTTIIDKLAELGYATTQEVVREYVKEFKSSPEELEVQLRSKEAHQEVLSRRMQQEKKLPPDQYVILDRGVHDSFAYYELNGHDVNESEAFAAPHLKQYRYKCVFIFEKLPFKNDGIRHESEEERDRLDKLYFHYYVKYGYKLIIVPVMPVETRLEYLVSILNKMHENLDKDTLIHVERPPL